MEYIRISESLSWPIDKLLYTVHCDRKDSKHSILPTTVYTECMGQQGSSETLDWVHESLYIDSRWLYRSSEKTRR